MSEIIWEAKKMSAGFNETEGTLEGASFQIKAGEKIALFGHERSCRGILFRVLAGLRPVRAGSFNLLGFELKPQPGWVDWDHLVPRNVRRKLGVSLTVDGLLSNVSVREGMELLFRFKYGDHNEKLREGARRVVDEVCSRFSLGDAMNKRPVMLSKAERRLASLARAFLTKPPVVMAENPSQDIGDLNQQRLWYALDELCSSKDRTVVLSTDDWAIAAQYTQRWIVCEGPEIVFDGAPRDFLKTDHNLVHQFHGIKDIRRRYEGILEDVA